MFLHAIKPKCTAAKIKAMIFQKSITLNEIDLDITGELEVDESVGFGQYNNIKVEYNGSDITELINNNAIEINGYPLTIEDITDNLQVEETDHPAYPQYEPDELY